MRGGLIPSPLSMAYIAPNTTIYLLSGVPLNNSYGDTIYFANATAQQMYFQSKVAVTLSSQSYQRKDKNVLRVTIPYGQTYNVNYLMWRNNSYENKWFYAFILNVDYVNNETWEVTYEIDVMQTWFFDFTLEQCFIEREHSATDAIGDNITPESVDCGEMEMTTYGELFDSQEIMAIVLLIVDSDAVASGTKIDGIYSGCRMFAYNDNDIESVQNKISEYAQATDSIVSIYMCPLWLFGPISTGGAEILVSNSGKTFHVTKPAITADAAIGGYTPKNNKLYTYPYNYYQVDNGSGGTMKVRYEFFSGLQPQFYVGGTVITPVSLICQPINYKGVTGTSMEQAVHTENLTLDGFPTCSWNTDYFAAWAAQNSVPILINTLGQAGAAAGAGFAVGGPAGAAAGAVGSLASQVGGLVSQGYTAAIHADISKGNLNIGNVNCALKINRFNGGRVHVSAEYARMIDDYFTVFGYATHRVKVPNTHVRPHWTYTKTVGCMITGSVPGGDAAEICRIHDNGITYWMSGDEVGNYSLDNSPET